MSIMRCDKHQRNWDSDKIEECPLCENEPSAPTASARDAATPRTDAFRKRLGSVYGRAEIDFARTLERELAALQSRPALSEERIAEIAQECWDKWQHDEDAQVYAAAAIRQALKESGR